MDTATRAQRKRAGRDINSSLPPAELPEDFISRKHRRFILLHLLRLYKTQAPVFIHGGSTMSGTRTRPKPYPEHVGTPVKPRRLRVPMVGGVFDHLGYTRFEAVLGKKKREAIDA